MNYWLIKSEPYKYSRDQFVKEWKTMRDGIRNYQARNNLKSMKTWDICLRYHSNEWKEIVGIAKVSKESYPDPTSDDDKKWRVVVEVVPDRRLKKSITLEQIKQDPNLKEMMLLKQQRLSVSPVRKEEFDYIIQLSEE